MTAGLNIDAYSDAELVRLAHWIRTDDLLRTEDELLQEMMRELGFQRRGKNVVAKLTAAIALSAPGSPGRNGRDRLSARTALVDCGARSTRPSRRRGRR
jgi:hypothetical protein